jgi:hypothetical protein
MVIAIVALIAALGGTAIAGGVLNKKKVNKIVTNRAPGLSVSHAKTADSATNANTANTVGGLHVVNFHLNGASPIANQKILDLNGLQLFASCASGSVTATAQTTVNGGEISAWSDDASSTANAQAFDDSFNVGDTFTLPEATHSDTLSSGAYTGGNLQTVRFFYNEEDSIGGQDCLFNGYAIG